MHPIDLPKPLYCIGGKLSFVAATETSPEEAVAYESNKLKKKPFLDLAAKVGAIGAIRQLTSKSS